MKSLQGMWCKSLAFLYKTNIVATAIYTHQIMVPYDGQLDISHYSDMHDIPNSTFVII